MDEWAHPAPLVVLGTVALALLVLIATFVACLAASARTGRAVWPLPVVAGAIAAPMVAIAWVVRRTAAEFGRASSATDPSEMATGLANAFSAAMHSTTPFLVGEMALIPFGAGILLMSVARGRSPLAALAVVATAAGLEVLLYGALGFVHALTGAFQAVATADPAEKKDLLLAATAEAQGRFDTWILSALALGAIAGLFAMVAAARRYAADLPGRDEVGGGASTGGAPSSGAAALLAVLGIAGIATSVPALREAQVVLPPSARLPVPPHLETPALAGPDRLRRAPVISLDGAGRLTLEGFALESASLLGPKLEELRRVEAMIRPSAAPTTGLTLAVDGRARGAQLRELLVALSAEGYADLQLVFVSSEELARPLLGSTTVTEVTAVDASVDAEAPGPSVSFTDEDTFAELAPALAKHRANGATPVLDLATPSP